MRLFVAIDLPEHVKEQVAGLCCGLPGARWLKPEQLHLTLRFIGEVDGGMFRDIREGLLDVRQEQLSLRLDGVGFFPPRGKPRVVWVGLQQSVDLFQLHDRINSRLTALGLEPETRKFAPHITIARLKNTPPARVGRFLENHNLFCSAPFWVDEFFLYSSRLGRNGAIHRIEAGYPLAV